MFNCRNNILNKLLGSLFAVINDKSGRSGAIVLIRNISGHIFSNANLAVTHILIQSDCLHVINVVKGNEPLQTDVKLSY